MQLGERLKRRTPVITVGFRASIEAMRIAFHANQICLQGTEVALYDYAHFSEVMLGHEAVVISKDNPVHRSGGVRRNQPAALKKFKARFPLILYKRESELEGILRDQNVDVLYAIKKGPRDGLESSHVKTVVHVVFKYYEPHGDVYAYVSKWLSDLMTGGKAPFVPHMIHLPRAQGDLRDELGIPHDAVVFGRYGGTRSFNVGFVRQFVEKFAVAHPDVYFLFMNTSDFLNPGGSLTARIRRVIRPRKLPNVIFIPGTSLMEYKSKFINTCDAMLHARANGETFGMAIGEFSSHNVPVITYSNPDDPKFESNHIEILGDKGLVYSSLEELERHIHRIIDERDVLSREDWDAYSEFYGPEPVMRKFAEVFLEPTV